MKVKIKMEMKKLDYSGKFKKIEMHDLEKDLIELAQKWDLLFDVEYTSEYQIFSRIQKVIE